MVVLVCWCDRCDRCYTLKLLLFRQIASMLYTAMDLKICFLFFGFRSTMISGSRRFDGCNPFWVCPLRRTPYRLGQIGFVGNWSSANRRSAVTQPYRLGQIGFVGNLFVGLFRLGWTVTVIPYRLGKIESRLKKE